MLRSIREEARRMLENKLMIIILFVIPIAANLLIGFEFQGNEIRHIPMAVVDQDNSSLSRMIIQQFAESDTFSVKYILDNDAELKALMEQGKAKTGMIIPAHFSQDVTGLKGPSILMLYDGSHMSIASTAKSKASEILLTLKTGISMKMIGGKLSLPGEPAENTARLIRFDSRFLYNPSRSYKYFLNPGLGVAVVQTAIVLLGAVCIRKENLDGDFFTNIGYITGKIVFYALLGTVSLLTSVLIQSTCFGIPFRGSIYALLILSLMMAFSAAAFSVMVSVLVPDTALASLVVAVLFIPSTALAGYTWPVLSMPKIYKCVAYMMPFSHYGTQLRDLYLKGVPFYTLWPDLRWFGCFILGSFAVASIGVKLRSLPIFMRTAVIVEEE